MEYFDWYSIEPALDIDEKALQQAYYKKSKEYHPDFHIEGTEEEQARIMQQSVLNTNAYNTLKQFDSRLKYILEQKGLVAEGDKYVLPPGFLVEMMDINEQIADALTSQDAADMSMCAKLIQDFDAALKEGILPIREKNVVRTLSDIDLQALLDYHYKQRYVWRMYARLRNENDL